MLTFFSRVTLFPPRISCCHSLEDHSRPLTVCCQEPSVRLPSATLALECRRHTFISWTLLYTLWLLASRMTFFVSSGNFSILGLPLLPLPLSSMALFWNSEETHSVSSVPLPSRYLSLSFGVSISLLPCPTLLLFRSTCPGSFFSN